MGKYIEEQSPWLKDELIEMNSEFIPKQFSEIPIDSSSMPIPTSKENIVRDSGAISSAQPTGTNNKNLWVFLIYFFLVIALILLIGFLLSKLGKGLTGDTLYRGIIRNDQIKNMTDSDYKTNPIDDEYSEITSKNKDVLNKPFIEQDIETKIQAATKPTGCEEKKNWDKETLGGNELVNSYIKKNGKKTTIAIIDTGVNPKNESIKNNIDIEHSYNVPDKNTKIDDLNGHGTASAKLVLRYYPQANIQVIKASKGKEEKVSMIDVVYAINFAIKSKPDVINIGIAGKGKKLTVMQKTIDKATAAGIVIVAAAGNDSDDVSSYYPAAYSGVISAGSFDNTKKLSAFTNVGAKVNNPGECINTDGNNFVNGTSYSAVITSAIILIMKGVGDTGSGSSYFLDKFKENSKDIDGVAVMSISRLIGIGDDNDAYTNSFDKLDKTLDKVNGTLKGLKENLKVNNSVGEYNRQISILRKLLLKSTNDVKRNEGILDSIFDRLGMDKTSLKDVFIDIDSDFKLVQDFIDGKMVTLEVTSERKLKQTLGVDSCYENVKNEKCSNLTTSKKVNCAIKNVGGKQMICGMFIPIISSGSYLPATGSGKYTTVDDNQKSLPFSIFVGENRLAWDNEQIGRVILENLPKKPAFKAGGNVRFTVDKYGTLFVNVVDSSNNVNIVESRIENTLRLEDALKYEKGISNLDQKIDNMNKNIGDTKLKLKGLRA